MEFIQSVSTQPATDIPRVTLADDSCAHEMDGTAVVSGTMMRTKIKATCQ